MQMGYVLTEKGCSAVLRQWLNTYKVFAPKRMAGGGTFSDTDCVRYGLVNAFEDIVFDEKSEFSFKEILTPVTQILFYYQDGTCKEPDSPAADVVIFLRSCDIHAVKRMDEIYLRNGAEDPYYKKLREHLKFVLIGCTEPYKSCFCVGMGTNRTEQYEAAVTQKENVYEWDCRFKPWELIFEKFADKTEELETAYVTETQVRVSIPQNLTPAVMKSEQWKEYDSRCINCGRCNFVCPTCTCFTMQDIAYTDNGRCGERRRVWASCMVDGFTDVAGGGSYRQQNGQRMRFKTLHKVYDFNKRFGYQMCVGCGRCDDVCPEYISFSHIISRLESMVKEVEKNDGK